MACLGAVALRELGLAAFPSSEVAVMMPWDFDRAGGFAAMIELSRAGFGRDGSQCLVLVWKWCCGGWSAWLVLLELRDGEWGSAGTAAWPVAQPERLIGTPG